jgi:hypothetical protein
MKGKIINLSFIGEIKRFLVDCKKQKQLKKSVIGWHLKECARPPHEKPCNSRLGLAQSAEKKAENLQIENGGLRLNRNGLRQKKAFALKLEVSSLTSSTDTTPFLADRQILEGGFFHTLTPGLVEIQLSYELRWLSSVK